MAGEPGQGWEERQALPRESISRGPLVFPCVCLFVFAIIRSVLNDLLVLRLKILLTNRTLDLTVLLFVSMTSRVPH